MPESAFYHLLRTDDGFCQALGRMTLAASRFESDLRVFLSMHGVAMSPDRATFGSLVAALKRHPLLSDNGHAVLRILKVQRNYVTHSLFDLYSGRIAETLLPPSDLVSMDVVFLPDRVRELEANLVDLARIAEHEMNRITLPNAEKRLLCRP